MGDLSMPGHGASETSLAVSLAKRVRRLYRPSRRLSDHGAGGALPLPIAGE